MGTLFGALLFFILAVPQQAPAAFGGTVMDPTGRALADVAVALVEGASGQRYEARTDASGRFSIGGVLAGDYRIAVSKPGFRETAGRVVLGAGQQVQRDVVPQVSGIAHMYRVTIGEDPGRARRTLVSTPVPPDPCKEAATAGCITPPARVAEAWPVYPAEHARKGTTANVTITGRLGADGFLTDLRAAEGTDAEFAAAAISALRQWEYSPMRLNGVPHEIPVTVTFRFITGTN